MLHTLCCGISIGVYGTSLGCLGSQKRRCPSGRLWIYGSLDPAPYVPAISAPRVKGLFGTHMLIPFVVEWILACIAKFGVPWFPETKASLWQIVILWQSGPCTLCTSNIGSLGQRAIWYTHVTYPLLWNEYWRIWPSLGCLGSQKRRRPSGRLWIYGSLDPASYVPAISAPWVKELFGTHMLHTLCYGMNIGVYGQVWDALVPRNEGVPQADCDFMAVWTLHPMYQQYRLPGSKGYLVHTCYIPSVMEWILAYMAQVWGALFPRNEGVPLADCDFLAVWTLHPMYQQYRLPGSKGYLVHTCYIPSVVEWILAYMAKFGCLGAQKRRRPSGRLWFYGSLDSAPYVPAISAPWVKGLFVTHMLHTLCCGMNIGEYDQVWGALVPKKRRLPSGRLRLYGSLGPAAYVPAISAPWVKGLFGTHMLHTLCCGMNIGIYGLVYGALVPRNEGVPQADCEFIAFRTLYPMYQQYRLPGSEGYLVHTCYIPSVVEWILAYMASFGVPWFPETKASLWPIVILWQSGPCTPRISNIGSLGQRAIWYTHVTYPLLWNEYWRLWPSLGCLGSQNRRRPSCRLWFYGSLVPAPYVPAISAP